MLAKLVELLPAGGEMVQNVAGMVVGAVLTGLVSVGYFAGESWTRQQVRDELNQSILPRLNTVEKQQAEFRSNVSIIKQQTARTEALTQKLLDLQLKGSE